MHEKQLHDSNSFITLTYNDEKLPVDGTLVKRDLVLFMKRLRKWKGAGVRFYACGEYGDRSLRPHYHVLLFNCDFPDRRFYKKAKAGEPLYTSVSLSKLWLDGFSVVGDVTFDSCAYVARYIMKKRNGHDERFYSWVDHDGVCHSVIPEFTVMSRRPGLGFEWFAKFGEHAFNFDSVIMNGREIRPPRYYGSKYELVDAVSYERIKLKRRLAAQAHLVDNRVDRRRVKELVELKRLQIFQRDGI